MDQSLMVLLKWYTSVSLQFQIPIKEVRQVQKWYLFATAWMTPFFHVNLCSPEALLDVPHVVLPQERLCAHPHTGAGLACGLYAQQTVPLCRALQKPLCYWPSPTWTPVLSEDEVVVRPRQAPCTQLGLLAAHLLGLRSTRFSQTAEVCTINERLWPTSYSIIGFGLVYMGRLHQFSLSPFLKWFD